MVRSTRKHHTSSSTGECSHSLMPGVRRSPSLDALLVGWPAALAVAKNTLVCAAMKSAICGVILVSQPPSFSMRINELREPLRVCTPLTLG